MTLHAKVRAFQRFGIAASSADISAALCDIQHGRAILARRKPDGTSEWLVSLADRTMRAVLAASGDAILTILPTGKNERLLAERNASRKGFARGKPEQRRHRGIMEDID